MPLDDDASLEALQEWRDELVAALKTPSTVNAWGGMPDSTAPVRIQRMAGRAQLLTELQWVEKRIEELEGGEPLIRESRGAT